MVRSNKLGLFSVSGCESIELPDYSVYTTCTQWLHYPSFHSTHYSGKEGAFSLNFRLRRGLVKTFNIPVEERNAACGSIAKEGSSMC